MAETFKNARKVATTSYADIYVCPAGTTAIVISLQAANVGAVSRTVSAQYLDDSAADAATRLVEAVTIPVGAAIDLVAKRVVLEAGDALQVKASANTDVEVSAHVLEIT